MKHSWWFIPSVAVITVLVILLRGAVSRHRVNRRRRKNSTITAHKGSSSKENKGKSPLSPADESSKP
jgi:hypothetical protein